MKLPYLIFPFILGAASLASNAQTAPTIKSVVAAIEANNLSLKSASAANHAEIAEMKASNIIGPTSVEYSPFFRSGVTGLASSELIVKQEFDFPTQYAARSKAADARGRALEAAVGEQRRSLRIEATQACIDWIGACKRIEILHDRLKLVKVLLNLYEQKYEMRSATALELNQIKLAKIDVERELAAAASEAEDAAAIIKGLNGGESIELQGLDYPEQLDDFLIAVDPREYARRSPAVVSAEADIKASEAEVSVAKGSWLPTIGVGYRRNTEGSESSNGFIVGLDFPLFSTARQKKAAEARKAAAELSLIEADRNAESEASSVVRRLESMRKTLSTEDPDLIRSTIDLYAESLRLGQITLTDFCRETDSLFDRSLTIARMEQDYRSLAATLIE